MENVHDLWHDQCIASINHVLSLRLARMERFPAVLLVYNSFETEVSIIRGQGYTLFFNDYN